MLEDKAQRQRYGWDLDKLINKVCDYSAVSEKQFFSKARSNAFSQGKTLICFWGTQELDIIMREMANRLAIRQSAVSGWVQKGKT